MNPTMTDFHKDQILRVLMYHLQPEMRRLLMDEVPAAYNDYCGRYIVKTSVVSSNGAS